MNKKLIFGIGAVAIISIGGFLLTRGNNPMVKKEIKLGQDVCSEFPKEWVTSVIHKPIINTKEFAMKGTYKCTYFLDDTNFVTLGFDELNFETQKKGQQELGKTITTNNTIPMSHFVALSSNNLIYDIILEITPNVFFSVDRYPETIISETEMVDFATKVAERIKNGENQGLRSASTNAPTSEPTKKPEANSAPLPQDKDMVNNFFTLIDEGKASDAVMMMSSKNTSDDSTKQAFGVQYAAMESVKVKTIEESSKADWTDTWHQYMVTLDVVMNPNSANGPIPYYGFERGENTRFITLIKEGSSWKIEGISTGP
jgi:hypothetical protein